MVLCRAGVRFKAGFGGRGGLVQSGAGQVCGSRKVPEVPGGLVQGRCKVQGRFWTFRGGLPGSIKVPEVSGWSGAAQV